MSTPPPPPVDAVLVLAGGRSRRLGRSKAALPFDGAPLLVRIVERLGPLAAPGEVVVAARPGQDLPVTGARRVDDRHRGVGPLAGLSAGLSAVAGRLGPDARVAVSACDYPFADPALLRALAAALGDAAIAACRHEGRLHVLQAVWRAGLAGACEAALERGDRRVVDALEGAPRRVLEAADLPAGIDARRALLNVNDSADLARARALGGDPPPEDAS